MTEQKQTQPNPAQQIRWAKARKNRQQREANRSRRTEIKFTELLSDVARRLEATEKATWPEPDFDDGWVLLESHQSIHWTPDEKRPVARVDVLRKTGEDEFERVPGTVQEGDTWYRPWPPGSSDLNSIVIYNKSPADDMVRVQGWYESRNGH